MGSDYQQCLVMLQCGVGPDGGENSVNNRKLIIAEIFSWPPANRVKKYCDNLGKQGQAQSLSGLLPSWPGLGRGPALFQGWMTGNGDNLRRNLVLDKFFRLGLIQAEYPVGQVNIFVAVNKAVLVVDPAVHYKKCFDSQITASGKNCVGAAMIIRLHS